MEGKRLLYYFIIIVNAERVLIIHMCDYYSQEEGQAGTRKPMREVSRRWMPRRSDGGIKKKGGEIIIIYYLAAPGCLAGVQCHSRLG